MLLHINNKAMVISFLTFTLMKKQHNLCTEKKHAAQPLIWLRHSL